jgi:hypothetical protein
VRLENENFDFGFKRASAGVLASTRCYLGSSGNASPTSTSNQTANEYQSTAGNGGASVGSSSNGNTINITSGDTETAQAALAAGVLQNQSANDLAAHLADVAGAVTENGINSNTLVATGAIGVANNSLELVAQNDASTAAEVNTQTALAFSTIDHLITGQTAGQEAAASDAAALQLSAAQGYGASAAQPQVIIEPNTGYSSSSQPTGGGSLFTSTSTYNFVWIIAGGLTVWYFLKGKKA